MTSSFVGKLELAIEILSILYKHAFGTQVPTMEFVLKTFHATLEHNALLIANAQTDIFAQLRVVVELESVLLYVDIRLFKESDYKVK